MKDMFREFETLKPENTAKLRLQQIMEEKEMKKSIVARMWKPVVISAFVFGILCIPVVQQQMGNSIQVKAKEVEKLNHEIESMNSKYKNGELTYQDYKVEVDGLIQSRDEVMGEIHADNPDYKITVVEGLDENDDPSIEVIIEDK